MRLPETPQARTDSTTQEQGVESRRIDSSAPSESIPALSTMPMPLCMCYWCRRGWQVRTGETMIWTNGAVADDRESRGTIDGGTYRALVMRNYERETWIGTVDLYMPDYHYVATSLSCADAGMAEAWCAAALLQLQRVAGQLGEVQ